MDENTIELDDLEEGEYPSGAIKADDDNFRDLVGAYGTVVVDLWAPWCGPCKAFSPVVNQMADELHGQVVFAKMDIDQNKETSAEFMVQSIPTLLIFKDGVFKDRITGAMDKKTVIRKIMSV